MSKGTPLESKIETYLKNQIKAIGGLCYKFKSTVNGVPDQLVIFNQNMYLVEVKRPNEVPRANQVHVHNQIKKQGVTVYTVDTISSIDSFIKNVLGIDSTVNNKNQKPKQASFARIVKSK